MELSPRRQRILKHVVEEYVRTAVPVSSEAIVRGYQPELSTATVRNELAQLEDLGLVSHPHTSAGRIPTDVGYRFYVEHLMERADPSPGEQRAIRQQFHQLEPDVGRWVHLASSVLANAVQAAAVVTPPASDRRSFEDVYYEGLAHILSQPEFTYSHKVVPLVQVLERGAVLGQLLSQALDVSRVVVVIGHEHPLQEMWETSAVLTGYGRAEDVQGVVGVLGPTRMPYWRAVAMVRFMAGLMGLLVASEAERRTHQWRERDVN
ncbi:MAG: hypothetical protein H0V51_20375 [Chloroflexi bacterium]|nr:hypothetical protein [Chloroflexota bacterium]